MLNKSIKVRITKPVDPAALKAGNKMLNYGIGEIQGMSNGRPVRTYVMGVNYPVTHFAGRVIALIKRGDRRSTENAGYENKVVAVVAAPKNTRFVNYEIIEAIEFAERPGTYKLECLYENSCGAVVFREINGEPRFLLIKNKRSRHWGFPKGHMEKGENPFETAKREVLEETGLNINIINDFSSKSEYIIGKKVQKEVRIFLGSTKDTQTKIQREEIDDYIWLPYEQAINTLNFSNDKRILNKAHDFMKKERIGYSG